MTEFEHMTRDFLRDDAGSPLGPGMPSGGPLRADGESHYEAWQALLRRDPCSYCGARGAAGTVDHVDARSRPARGLGTAHGWVNTVGACVRCNGAKRDLGLLVFLYRRRWSAANVHPGEPARARRLRVGRADRRASVSSMTGSVNTREADLERARRVAEDGLILRGLVGSTVHGLSNPGTDDRDETLTWTKPFI